VLITRNSDDEKRNSGVGGIGMGMLAGDDSSDEDDAPPPRRPPPTRQPSNSPPRMNGIPAQRGPPPPGLGVHPPHPAMSPPPPGPISRPTQALQPAPQLAHPRAAFMPPIVRPGTTEPHALAIPSTPIVAKFQVHDDLGKNRTTVFGDEFWMRFNKVAENEQKKEARKSGGGNSFMREYAGGTTRLSKWVWCCSVVLLLAIVGGIVAGWYFSRNDPAQPPSVFGGSEDMNSITPAKDVPTTTPGRAAVTTPTPTPALDRRAVHRRRRELAMEQLD